MLEPPDARQQQAIDEVHHAARGRKVVICAIASTVRIVAGWLRFRRASYCPAAVTTVLVVLLMVGALAGCGEFLKPIPPGYTEQHGSRDYPQAPEAVYQACVSALQSGGFPLAVQRPDLGRIETGTRLTNMSGHMIQNSVVIESDGDAWTLQIEHAAAGSRVIAYPRHFHNGVEHDRFFLSELDERWRPLFAAIDNYLPR